MYSYPGFRPSFLWKLKNTEVKKRKRKEIERKLRWNMVKIIALTPDSLRILIIWSNWIRNYSNKLEGSRVIFIPVILFPRRFSLSLFLLLLFIQERGFFFPFCLFFSLLNRSFKNYFYELINPVADVNVTFS